MKKILCWLFGHKLTIIEEYNYVSKCSRCGGPEKATAIFYNKQCLGVWNTLKTPKKRNPIDDVNNLIK